MSGCDLYPCQTNRYKIHHTYFYLWLHNHSTHSLRLDFHLRKSSIRYSSFTGFFFFFLGAAMAAAVSHNYFPSPGSIKVHPEHIKWA